jgi:hypothetical protein
VVAWKTENECFQKAEIEVWVVEVVYMALIYPKFSMEISSLKDAITAPMLQCVSAP